MELNETHILAYLQGNLSAEDTRRLETLLQQSDEFRRTFNEISRIHSLADNLQKQRSRNSLAAWNKLSRRVSVHVFRHRLWNFSRTAAAVLLPLFLVFQYVLMPAITRSQSVGQITTVVSAAGMITKTVLPDGSEVWLNAQSTLTYPQRFGRKERQVQLSGEAYFKVSADKNHPFNVLTPQGLTVSAYGTEFNVNAYSCEKLHEVTLAEGSVGVSAGNAAAPKILNVGEKAVLDVRLGNISVAAADTYVETAWKDGKMVFRREKLDKIAEKLSRKFGVTILLQGEDLTEYEYTATFTNETLDDILDLMKRSAPITYTVSNQKQLDNDTFSPREITIKSIR